MVIINTNNDIPRESFSGSYKKIHLPSAQDLCDLICTAGKGCFLYSVDMARAYRQLPLGPEDWSLVCFNFQEAYYSDTSLPFGLRWAAAHCQDVTSLITRELKRKGAAILSHIDDYGGVATDQASAATISPTSGLYRRGLIKLSPHFRSWCDWASSSTQ